ncbi:protein STPG3-like [Watersipora subatra]|uniref:protein STPG3-like n=1 Tax=Watersipora subatra TaxID=2589382 RepID=UPI00355C79B9
MNKKSRVLARPDSILAVIADPESGPTLHSLVSFQLYSWVDPQRLQPVADKTPCDVRYKEIIESRPPLRTDLTTPGPWAYSPHTTKPLNETNAPSFTMRPRCWAEKGYEFDRLCDEWQVHCTQDIGGRTSWSKTWYQSPEVWTSKTNFGQENVWPTPSTYDEKLRIGGEHQSTRARYPVFSMGHRYKMSMVRPDTDQEPSPASYQKDLADGQVFTRAPAVIHAVQTNNFGLWGRPDRSPGPAAYSPSLTFVKRSQPSFSLSRSSREGLKPLLGPFASS